MRHTISVLVENKFGVLTRVAGLFSGRGYNIDSLNVAPTQDPTTSRMTIVTRGDDATVDQIVKQLNKLVNVMHVHDFREGEYVDRELALVKVTVDDAVAADETFDMLMGTAVPPRKKFIQTHARDVVNLDV